MSRDCDNQDPAHKLNVERLNIQNYFRDPGFFEEGVTKQAEETHSKVTNTGKSMHVCKLKTIL